MTPQLQQAIRLLQLSSLDLAAEIQEVLDSNPLLDVDEDSGAVSADEGSALPEPSYEPNYDESGNGQDTAVHDSGMADDFGGEAAHDSTLETSDALNKNELPDELPVDAQWEDDWSLASAMSGSRGDDDDRDFEVQGKTGETLQEHLLWQLRLTPMSPTDQAIALAIIDAIDDNGYLTTPLPELREALGVDSGVELDEIQAVLKRIQTFDPPGVAARNLKECLLIQLAQFPSDTPWLKETRKLVSDHLELLGSKDFKQIMRRMKLSEDELRILMQLIQTLNPHPGGTLSSNTAEYIVPDVFVFKNRDRWVVDLNPDCAPRLKINADYASLIRRADSSSDNTFLRNHLQEAKWFIKSLQSRNETLLKVAKCIVEHQQAFLEYGEEAMKPLVLHHIAEAVEMHESTISRVTTQKYMHTPRGIFELKYFFSSHVSTASGGECSSTAIRALIKKLISAENPKKPLSDSKLTDLLSDNGINVARRTIAKYREAMAIPPSNERKSLI